MLKFSAKIYLNGINPCVDVPSELATALGEKGNIPVKGKIEDFHFRSTLVPVKDAPYRLFVNSEMRDATDLKVGDTAHFEIEPDLEKRVIPMPELLNQRLLQEGLHEKFNALTSSRKKDILNYLNFLKTEAALIRNVEIVIGQLKS